MLVVQYTCSNCKSFTKVLYLQVWGPNSDENKFMGAKAAEYPPFSPPVPPKLFSLVGPDQDLFIKGRRCESQGLGVGAFAYYRRVVENEKNRFFDEIIGVCKLLKTGEEFVKQIEAAKQETQFNKSVTSIKAAIPDALKIDGHNPLLLLHDALSEGIHNTSDEACLETAESIRVVLTELAERMAHLRKEQGDLKKAVSRLLQVRQKSNQ